MYKRRNKDNEETPSRFVFVFPDVQTHLISQKVFSFSLCRTEFFIEKEEEEDLGPSFHSVCKT
jgi:hypothetical protein